MLRVGMLLGFRAGQTLCAQTDRETNGMQRYGRIMCADIVRARLRWAVANYQMPNKLEDNTI